jgi:hypothetical protein
MKTEIHYNNDLELLLKEQAEQAESYSILHNLSYEKYQFRSNIINIPVIILSSVIGLLTGMNIQNDDMFIILSTGSIFVSVIKSIDSYFQLQKRAEGHRICGLTFSQISKKIQIELSLQRDQRQNPKDMLALIKTDLKNLFDISPLVDSDIIDKYNSLYKNENEVSKPPITNGLTRVKINKENDERQNVIKDVLKGGGGEFYQIDPVPKKEEVKKYHMGWKNPNDEIVVIPEEDAVEM